MTEIVKESTGMNPKTKERIEQIRQGIVPEGYKKTRFGIMPEDWEIKSLNDLIKLFGGNAFKSTDSSKCGVRWLKIANVGIGRVKWNEVDFLPVNFKEKYSEYVLQVDDIVMALTRPIINNKLKIARLKKEDVPSLLNQRVARIIVKPHANSEYIYYLLSSREMVINIERQIAGTDPPNVSYKDIKNIKVNLPNNVYEQQKIADVLSTWDRAIELKEVLIREKEEQRIGLKNYIFSYSNMEKWRKLRLGDIGEFRTSSINKKYNPDDTQVKLLNYMDVYNNNIINNNIDYMRTTATEHQKEINNVKKGDVFFTPSSETRDDIGHSAVALEDVDDLVYSYHLIRYRIGTDVDFDLSFRGHCFNNSYILRQMSRLSTGSTRYTLSLSDLENVEFYLPPLDEQRKIANLLSTADKEISLLKQELELLKEQKKGLMQLLLTGIVRVGEVE